MTTMTRIFFIKHVQKGSTRCDSTHYGNTHYGNTQYGRSALVCSLAHAEATPTMFPTMFPAIFLVIFIAIQFSAM